MDKEVNTTRDPAEELRSQDPETPTLQPYPDWKGQPLTDDQCRKVLKVLSVCDQDQKVDALCALATSVDGLVDDEVRSKTCKRPYSSHFHATHNVGRANSIGLSA